VSNKLLPTYIIIINSSLAALMDSMMCTPACRSIIEFRNVEVSKILKSWWEGLRSMEPGVDGEKGEKG
jgi:hypothetical protein